MYETLSDTLDDKDDSRDQEEEIQEEEIQEEEIQEEEIQEEEIQQQEGNQQQENQQEEESKKDEEELDKIEDPNEKMETLQQDLNKEIDSSSSGQPEDKEIDSSSSGQPEDKDNNKAEIEIAPENSKLRDRLQEIRTTHFAESLVKFYKLDKGEDVSLKKNAMNLVGKAVPYLQGAASLGTAGIAGYDVIDASINIHNNTTPDVKPDDFFTRAGNAFSAIGTLISTILAAKTVFDRITAYDSSEKKGTNTSMLVKVLKATPSIVSTVSNLISTVFLSISAIAKTDQKVAVNYLRAITTTSNMFESFVDFAIYSSKINKIDQKISANIISKSDFKSTRDALSNKKTMAIVSGIAGALLAISQFTYAHMYRKDRNSAKTKGFAVATGLLSAVKNGTEGAVTGMQIKKSFDVKNETIPEYDAIGEVTPRQANIINKVVELANPVHYLGSDTTEGATDNFDDGFPEKMTTLNQKETAINKYSTAMALFDANSIKCSDLNSADSKTNYLKELQNSMGY